VLALSSAVCRGHSDVGRGVALASGRLELIFEHVATGWRNSWPRGGGGGGYGWPWSRPGGGRGRTVGRSGSRHHRSGGRCRKDQRSLATAAHSIALQTQPVILFPHTKHIFLLPLLARRLWTAACSVILHLEDGTG